MFERDPQAGNIKFNTGNIFVPVLRWHLQVFFSLSELCLQFHCFAIRKMHFLKRARQLVAYPGGFGTLDELFETLTLVKTGKIKPLPILRPGREYWQGIINFEAMVDEGVIGEKYLSLFQYVDCAE